MKVDQKAVFLGVIMGTPIGTMASYALGIGSVEGTIISQSFCAIVCLLWYIRKVGESKEES